MQFLARHGRPTSRAPAVPQSCVSNQLLEMHAASSLGSTSSRQTPGNQTMCLSSCGRRSPSMRTWRRCVRRAGPQPASLRRRLGATWVVPACPRVPWPRLLRPRLPHPHACHGPAGTLPCPCPHASAITRLAQVVPNLVSNEVVSVNPLGGARLKQVGAAKLAPGVVFKATTTLDVRTYMDGLPAEMEADHLVDDSGDKQSTDSSAVREFGSVLPLTWDVFPRPYCISALPHRDVTMQGVQGVGDFRHYQGVWRLQPLPGCAPPGSAAMRLTYSVELSPRAWVPVALLEGQIASALGENLIAIRDYVVAEAESTTGRSAPQLS